LEKQIFLSQIVCTHFCMW